MQMYEMYGSVEKIFLQENITTFFWSVMTPLPTCSVGLFSSST